MYGLLLEAISDLMKAKYGEEKWEEIRKRANVDTSVFSTHEIYDEDVIPNIAQAAADVLDMKPDDVMDVLGVGFVSFVGQYGYDSILKVLGRHMRDFLSGLDNLHEYLRFSYPKLRPPSFFVENENKTGLTLHYRSRRRGYKHYVMGQIRQVGQLFYNTKVNIFVVNEKENEADGTIHVTFRLLFNNVAFRDSGRQTVDSIVDTIPLRSELLFELFPFHLVFGRSMEIRSVGSALAAVLPGIMGKHITKVFHLSRPLTKLTWEEVLAHTNNVFELVSKQLVEQDLRGDDEKSLKSGKPSDSAQYYEDSNNRLHVKGQMLFMSEWECIMFLGTPVMKSLDDMFNSGLYINDLSMHDSSRDLVLAGTQQSAELKLALDQEQEKSRLLQESMKKLDSEMKRTDALLYQMIPKPVADRLRRGEPSVNTCQAFDSVTILFSDVVGFTTICSRITPMEVVSMLNAMYTEFDQLSEKHDVYKVETIGDAYMAVAGAPTVSQYHALNMCNMSLDMLLAMMHLKDPSTQDNMKIRVGIHTGATVAGVVGIKMPRYCLFGDSVNTASRMETNGEAMKIHISETTREKLLDYPYKLELRGQIEVKGKGSMKTYWLLGRDDDPKKAPRCPFAQLMEQEKQQHLLDRKSPTDVSASRPVYSPVSFDDLNTDSSHPHGSPSQSSGGGDYSSRRGSKASAALRRGVAEGGREAAPAAAASSCPSAAVHGAEKPMQAVTPTCSESASSPSSVSVPTSSSVKHPEVWTVVTSPVPDNKQQQQQHQQVPTTYRHSHEQENGIPQRSAPPPQHPHHIHEQHVQEQTQNKHYNHSNNSSQHNNNTVPPAPATAATTAAKAGNRSVNPPTTTTTTATATTTTATRVNNNDKSRHEYPVSTSDVQEPCSPVKHFSSADTGRTDPVTGSNHSAAKTKSNKASKSGGVKIAIQDGETRNVSDASLKDSRTEKPKSKTCSLL